MKLKYLILSLTLWGSNASALDMILPVNNIHDGDTIGTTLPNMPAPLNKVGIRLLGIDAPELHGYFCESEHQLAIKARTRLVELIGSDKTIQVRNIKWDKYGGRIDGYVFNLKGDDVGHILINEGLAHSYNSGKKSTWCQTK